MERLVIFTNHYPYGNGEPFLEEEIKIAESRFDEIMIVSYAKQQEALKRYIPAKAEVIGLRRDGNRKSKLAETSAIIGSLFTRRTWREIRSGLRERGFRKLPTVIKTILLDNRHLYYLRSCEGYRTDGEQPKTVFYSYWTNAAAVCLSQRKERLNGVCICRAHGGDLFFDRGYVPWRKEVFKKMDRLFPICAGGKEDMILHYGTDVEDLEKKITVARLGVDIPAAVKEAPDAVLGEYLIVSCSNVIPLKRLDLLIRALADKRIRHPVRWVHFGDGLQFEEISELAEKCLGDSEYVTYEFKGRKEQKEIFEFYRENYVSLFVNCSDVEGVPVSIMEAMSYGIPVIARDVGSIGELVSDTCGVLLPGMISSEDLALSINGLLEESEEEFAKKRKAAREMVRNHYHSEKNYNLFFDEIEKTIREKADE